MLSKEQRDLIRKADSDRIKAGDITGLKRIENAIIRAIISRLASMSRDSQGGGRRNQANRNRLRQIENDIRKILKDDYSPKIKTFIRSFNEVENDAIAANLSINDIRTPKGLFREIRQFTVAHTEKQLLGAGIQSEVIDKWLVDISQQVLTGGDLIELEETISGIVTGKLNSYTRQIAMDTINQYHGAVQNTIGAEYGLTWLTYVGSIIETSRAQCRKWVAKRYLHKSELPEEIDWAVRNGSGMIAGTNPGNFAINRGGWGCRHGAWYVSDEVVPEADKARVLQAA